MSWTIRASADSTVRWLVLVFDVYIDTNRITCFCLNCRVDGEDRSTHGVLASAGSSRKNQHDGLVREATAVCSDLLKLVLSQGSICLPSWCVQGPSLCVPLACTVCLFVRSGPSSRSAPLLKRTAPADRMNHPSISGHACICMTDRLYHFISRPLPAAGPPPWVLHCLASDLARRRFLPDPYSNLRSWGGLVGGGSILRRLWKAWP